MNIAGLDIGTTGCKCTVFSGEGNWIAESYEEYSTEINGESHTIDPCLVWSKVCKVLKEISSKVDDGIDAIGVTTFGEASILLDENDQPLMNAFLFTDSCGEKECQEIVESLGEEYISSHTGLNPGKMYSAIKWRWIKKNRPDLLKRCTYICLFEDYIVYLLTGTKQIDYTLATRTMAFDVERLCWDNNILESVGISEGLLSKVVPMGTAAGYMKEDLRRKFSFSSSPLIVSGCHDQIAAAIGTGVLEKKMAVDGTGTIECISAIFSKDACINQEGLTKCGYAKTPFINNSYVTYAFSYTGGALLKWYRDQLAAAEANDYRSKGKNPYEEFNNSVKEEKPTGLLILPYFAGAGTPYSNKDATGVIVGLTLDTTKEQIYQGLMEGVTYEMKLNLEQLDQFGVHIDTVYATGGGANSSKWLQMKADIFNRRIVSLGAVQSGTLGCVMLAAVAIGRFKTLKEAAKKFIKYKGTYNPIENNVKEYEKQYKRYKEIYPKLCDILKEE